MTLGQQAIALTVVVFIASIGLLAGNELVARGAPVGEARHAVVVFGGDMMFDRAIRVASEQHGQDFILSCLTEVLDEADLVVANLEGPITDNLSVSATSIVGEPDNFTFTFPLATAETLARHHIRLVNLGNNHILNFGVAGERTTKEALERAGVAYFGDTAEQHVATMRVQGIPLAFINYNQFSNSSSRDKTVAQIQEARAKGYLAVVYAHWGDEYVAVNAFQKELAHAFVDAGAEIVIGSHPHVIQEHEVYRGKYVYYSLGNLVFDQYWDESVRRGLLLSVTFTSQGVSSVHETYTMLERDRRTCLAGE